MVFIIHKIFTNSARILLESVNKFSKGRDIKSTCTNQYLFYTPHIEKVMGTFSCTVAPKKSQRLGISLTKEMGNVYNKNFKPLKKDI